MKISFNWLKDYLDIKENIEDISDMLTSLGLESSFKTTSKSFNGVVLGKIVKCNPHENADRLSVCEVDIGENKNYTIICGAPNVSSGIYVPVAKVGAQLNNGNFTIKQAKIRGIKSYGMICSEKELSLSDEHEGIMTFNTEFDLGTPIEDIVTFNNDTLFEIDLTPNRGDCLSHLGVARELGIITKKNIKEKNINIIESDVPIHEEIKINVKDEIACPRYVARVIKGVKVGPSPKWLVKRLAAIGQSSINNIVDAANYVLMDTGHPMHTFDLDKINNKEIIVRYAKDGERITTLGDLKIELKNFHLVICDKKEPIAIAGIIGGKNSEVKNKTKNILIESAYFSSTVIRKGAKKIDFSTEASKRFERGTDINGTIPAINQLAALIVKIAGGKVCKGVIDKYPNEKNQRNIIFSLEKCEKLLGITISVKKIEEIFKSLNINFTVSNKKFDCIIPTFRNDLKREVDLIEEVARIIGYDKIPPSKEFNGSFNSFVLDEQELDSQIRIHLQNNGFSEHYSNSLQNEYDTNLFLGGKAIELKNPLSKDMAFIRNSIIPGLLMATSYNIKRQEKGFKLFEIGAIHNYSKNSKTESKEKFHLGLLWYGTPKSHWRKYEERDLYRCKGEIVQLLESMALHNISFKFMKEKGYKYLLKIYSNKIQLGSVGVLENKLLNHYDIKLSPILCDLSLSNIRSLWRNRKLGYAPPPAFPSIVRDIALQVSSDIAAEDLFQTINKEGGDNLKNVLLFDIYQSDEVGNNNKSLAFSLKFQSHNKTLTDLEVDSDVEKILNSLNKFHGANQR